GRGAYLAVPSNCSNGRGNPGIDGALFYLVDLGALVEQLLRLLGHAALRVVTDLLGDLHRAELGAAHRAEMRQLGAVGRQGLVVELLGRLGVEREVELVAPAEFEACPRQRVVALARARVALGEI